MTANNAYAKYKEQSVTTATPEELTLMLYNGCIKFINLAEVFIDDKNIEKNKFITKIYCKIYRMLKTR